MGKNQEEHDRLIGPLLNPEEMSHSMKATEGPKTTG
jgi:hypothetical protein